MSKIYQTLEIYRPLDTKKVSQGFGDNLACIDKLGKIFGIQKGKKCPGASFYESIGMKGHNGVDNPITIGEAVYHAATFPGWLTIESDAAGGLGVDVVSNEPLFFAFPIPPELFNTAVPHEQGGKQGFTHYVKLRYWHLHAPVGHNKKAITCGMIIGQAGNTGASSGPHLHWSPKWCLQDGRGVANNNGFSGAFDPTPYYNSTVSAPEHMRYLNEKVVPLTANERKDMVESLNAAQTLLLALKKLINKI